MPHDKLAIVCKNNKPYGIRDKTGYLFFFTPIRRYGDQFDRYRDEVAEKFELASYLMEKLKERK